MTPNGTRSSVVDQFEFGCAPQVAPDAIASPCWLLLRVYRHPVRAALRFAGRSVPKGKKVVIFSAYSSARHQSSAIFSGAGRTRERSAITGRVHITATSGRGPALIDHDLSAVN